MKIYSSEDIANLSGKEPVREQWTAVIPAAGRGSRLGYHRPKILYPVAGRFILDWLIDVLEPHCQKLIFILSPEGAQEVAAELEARLPRERWEYVIQTEPKGMADAIFQAVPCLETRYTLIVWGDQVALRKQTIREVLLLQESHTEHALTLPLVRRPEPYVHYATDEHGQLTEVLERREGATLPQMGESDCGVFAFVTNRLKDVFEQVREEGILLSKGTKEWNFLPMLPRFEQGEESVAALRLETLEETVGINNAQDAERVTSYLTQT